MFDRKNHYSSEKSILKLSDGENLPRHDSRCIRIGHNLLEGHPEDAQAELAAIQQKTLGLPSFLQFRFVYRSFINGQYYAKSFVSMIGNIKNKPSSNEIEKYRQTLESVGRIMGELVSDEGHVQEHNTYSVKMTVRLKELRLRF